MNFIRSVKLEKLTKELGYTAKLPAVKSIAKLGEFTTLKSIILTCL